MIDYNVFARALQYVLNVFEIAIFVRIILSWIPNVSNNKFSEFIFSITEPILGPIRTTMDKLTNGKMSMIDISPLIAFLLIKFVSSIIG